MWKATEIKNFTLLYNSSFWVEFPIGEKEQNRFPISFNPVELAKIFEKEGLDMKTPTRYDQFDYPEYDFRNVTLVNLGYADGTTFNVEYPPVICYYKIQD